VALRSYAESVGYWSPEKAVTVTNLIQDQVQREAAIESVIRSWSEVDIEAAKGWLAKQHVRLGLYNRLSGFFEPSDQTDNRQLGVDGGSLLSVADIQEPPVLPEAPDLIPI